MQLTMFGATTLGESPKQTADNIANTGAEGLLLFTSLYNGYRLIQPRYPERGIYALETDRVFYPHDPTYYKDCIIQPEDSLELDGRNFVGELRTACKEVGIKFSPLLPMCAGGRMVQNNPDIAVKNLYGSADRLFMCYNHPDVRAYRKAMLKEHIERFSPDGIMLDKIPQTMLEQSALNTIFDAPLRLTGSACFCEHCHAAAKELGLDLLAMQKTAKRIAERSLKVPPYITAALADQLIGDTEIPQLILEEPLIRELLEFRFATAVEFTKELVDVIKTNDSSITTSAAFVPPTHVGHDQTSPRAWLTVQSYKFYAEVFDELHSVVHWNSDVVEFETSRAVFAAEGKCKIHTGLRLYGATRPEDIEVLWQAALKGGADDVHFLGYDITSDDLLQALADASIRIKKTKL